jgi:hypothetical protein
MERYSVALEILSIRQISGIEVFLSAYRDWAMLIWYVISAAPLKELARGQLGLRGAEEGI